MLVLSLSLSLQRKKRETFRRDRPFAWLVAEAKFPYQIETPTSLKNLCMVA
jgi:hypothetical protein